jgi:hypothetical protein
MTRLLVFLTVLTYLHGPSATAQSLSPSPQAQEKPGAPPSGARLIFQEKSRDASPNGEFIRYVLRAEGLPQGKSYKLSGTRMNGSIGSIPDVLHVDGAGRVLSQNETEFELALGNMFAGEFVVFTLASEVGTAKASVEITPFPIEAVGNGDCRLSVKPLSVKGDMFSISGQGFKPGAKIKGVGRSSGEVMDTHLDNKGGNLKLVVWPAVVGKTGGEASLTASDSSCSVTVHYAWGDAMTKLSPTATRAASKAQPTPAMPESPAAVQSPGVPASNFEEARAAYDRGDYPAALKVFSELAAQGNAHAQALLGEMYMRGYGVKQNPVEGVGWYRKAASQGFAGAEVSLGACYEGGLGVTEDPAEAARWYRKAAEQADRTAQRYLGDMYAIGLGVPKDWKEAEVWYSKAAAQGDPEAAAVMKVPTSRRQRIYEIAEHPTLEGMLKLGTRAVDLDDQIGLVKFLITHPMTLMLGTEKVTQENAKDVLARLEAERISLNYPMKRMGVGAAGGDYTLGEPAKGKCKVFKDRPLQYPAKVSVIQTEQSIELHGDGINGCGYVLGKLIVMKAQSCGGTSPSKLLAVVTDTGIEDLTLIYDRKGDTSCKLGSLTRLTGAR